MEEAWIRIHGSRPNINMKDIEIILRALAMLIKGVGIYKSPMGKFLTDFSKECTKNTQEEIDYIKKLFVSFLLFLFSFFLCVIKNFKTSPGGCQSSFAIMGVWGYVYPRFLSSLGFCLLCVFMVLFSFQRKVPYQTFRRKRSGCRRR